MAQRQELHSIPLEPAVPGRGTTRNLWRGEAPAKRIVKASPGLLTMRTGVVAGLVALILLALGVRLAEPTGWLGSDDAAYYSAAEHVLSGAPIERLHHQYSRIAVILPVAASVAVFGHTPAATWLPMLLASLACVLLAAALGQCLFGWREGLFAAMIVALLPYFRILSTTAYPDVHACMWATVAIFLAVRATGGWRGARDEGRGGGTSGVTPRGSDPHPSTLTVDAALLTHRPSPGPRASSLAPHLSPLTSRPSPLIPRPFLALLCGVSLGLAVSAKLFAGPVSAAVVYLVLCSTGKPWRRRGLDLATIAAGGAGFLLLEGVFYWLAAGDFFYTMHAHDQATGLENPAAGSAAMGTAALAWDRLTMLFRSTTSGWGTLGVLFWPAMAAALLSRRARALAVWGLATYLGVAFMPVSFENGIKLNPLFHGRHVLSACIPFALCLAWTIGRIADWIGGRAGAADETCGRSGSSNRASRAEERSYDSLRVLDDATSRRCDISTPRRLAPACVWIACFGVALLLAYGDRHHLNGFVDRDTRRLGQAISAVIEEIDWNDEGAVLVAPSIYWRYRILFPQDLRARLRVAAEVDAPDWWKRVCPDIAERTAPLPPPGRDYLLATPRQLSGEAEHWDYGVGLPKEPLRAWQQTGPLATAVRDGTSLRLLRGPAENANIVLVLLGPPPQRLPAT